MSTTKIIELFEKTSHSLLRGDPQVEYLSSRIFSNHLTSDCEVQKAYEKLTQVMAETKEGLTDLVDMVSKNKWTEVDTRCVERVREAWASLGGVMGVFRTKFGL